MAEEVSSRSWQRAFVKKEKKDGIPDIAKNLLPMRKEMLSFLFPELLPGWQLHCFPQVQNYIKRCQRNQQVGQPVEGFIQILM
jgi:hypothetical protein